MTITGDGAIVYTSLRSLRSTGTTHNAGKILSPGTMTVELGESFNTQEAVCYQPYGGKNVRIEPVSLQPAQNREVRFVYKEERLSRPFDRIFIIINNNNILQPINTHSTPLYKLTLL